MIIQIYAFTDPKTAYQAAMIGVDQIGFVAGKYGVVHGELEFSQAREIVTALPPGSKSVALTMSTDIEEISKMAQAVNPDVVHISTDPEDVDVIAIKKLRRMLDPHIQIMKAIPVFEYESVNVAVEYAMICDILLLDSKYGSFPGVGATGRTHDWEVSRKIVESVSIPVILAGGLSAVNVEDAIRQVNPWGVDSNTLTNIEGSFVEKDLSKIEEFVKVVKNLEN